MTAELLDTAEVARRLNMSEDWVRDHAAELGAVRMGDSPRGPLRFNWHRVLDVLDRWQIARRQNRQRRRPGPPRGGAGVELLPLPKEVR